MARQKFSHTWYVAALSLAALALAVPADAKTELWVFSSPYCGPCQALKPTLAALESQGFPIRHVDITQRPALASKHGVDRVPCLIMVQDGREVTRQLGGDRGSIERMFAATGFKPGQQQTSAKSPSWSDSAQAPPSLPGGTPTASAPTEIPPADALAKQLLETSVRITVEDATGKSYGTGTIIDTMDQDALIVTCGHLFRTQQSQQQVDTKSFASQIIIEQFNVTASGVAVKDRTVGQLVYCDLERDVALVAFRPAQLPKVAPVAPSFGEQVNDRVYSVGCDRGADPTVRDSRVTAINRYNGPPNVETSGAPVQGRSGGGLFNSRGELVGVCFAADNEGNEGLYSGLASVHVGLDALGLQQVYRSQPQPDSPLADSGSRPDAGQLPPLPNNPSQPLVRLQSPTEQGPAQGFPAPPSSLPSMDAPPAPAQNLTPQEQAALQEIVRRGLDSEVTVIIRPRDPEGKSVVLQLDKVSPRMAEALGGLAR